jgi:RNA polymerase sigma factor (sigma-70 family)
MKSPARQLAEQRRQETVAYLWSCYDKDRENAELRNRLVEHYTPQVQQLARRYIRRYDLREADSAMSDALLLLTTRLVPHYDGHGDFARWAVRCVRRKMLERRRLERRRRKRFAAADLERDWIDIEDRVVRPNEPGSDVRFAELTSVLPGRDAAMLWLRFYRRFTCREIGETLGMSSQTTSKQMRTAIAALRTSAVRLRKNVAEF